MTADAKEWCLAKISGTSLEPVPLLLPCFSAELQHLHGQVGQLQLLGGGDLCNIGIGITAPALAEILCTAPLFAPDILGMMRLPKKLRISDLFWHLPCFVCTGA